MEPQAPPAEPAVKQQQDDDTDPDEKAKPQRLSQTQRWAIGVALFLFALGAWEHQKHGGARYPKSLVLKGLPGMEALDPVGSHSRPELGAAADLEAGPESLEDALSTLESGGDWAAHGIRLPDSSLQLPHVESGKPKKGKKAARAKPAAREPEEAEEEAEAPKPKAKAAQGQKPKRKAPKDGGEAAAALEKLEASAAGGKSKSKRKAEDDGDLFGSGLRERLEAMTQDEEERDRDPDIRKAKSIIKDAIKKMDGGKGRKGEADGDLLGGDLRERLEAMTRDEEERDRDPEIRKAKAIIKDAIKKMDGGKAGKGEEVATAAGHEDEEGAAGDPSHLEFAKRLKEEAAIKGDHDMATVREDFKREFGSDHRRMLCSGCKMVTARLTSELSDHDVHEAESPAHMIASKRKAIDATCRSLRHLHVESGEGGSRFVATEVAEGDETGATVRLGQKLCVALLEDAKFEVLSRLIQRKIPQASLFHGQESTSTNWERMICAQRARVCKRSEVREDDEDEEEL